MLGACLHGYLLCTPPMCPYEICDNEEAVTDMGGKAMSKRVLGGQFEPFQEPRYSEDEIAAMEAQEDEFDMFNTMMRDPGVPTKSNLINTQNRARSIRGS